MPNFKIQCFSLREDPQDSLSGLFFITLIALLERQAVLKYSSSVSDVAFSGLAWPGQDKPLTLLTFRKGGEGKSVHSHQCMKEKLLFPAIFRAREGRV